MLGAVGPALQRATLALAPHAACSRLLAVRPTQVFDLRSAHQRFIPRTFRWGLDGKALRAPILFFKPPSLPTVAAPCIKDPTTRLLADGLKASLESGALNVTVESNGRVELVACWQGSHRGLQPPNGSRLSCGALKKNAFPNLQSTRAASFRRLLGGAPWVPAAGFESQRLVSRIDAHGAAF